MIELSEEFEPDCSVISFLSKMEVFHLLTWISIPRLDRATTMIRTCITDSLTRNKIEARLEDESKTLAVPVLSILIFMGVYPWVGVYTMVNFEPMHCLLLCIRIILKNCVVLMLWDEIQTINSILCANGVESSF